MRLLCPQLQHNLASSAEVCEKVRIWEYLYVCNYLSFTHNVFIKLYAINCICVYNVVQKNSTKSNKRCKRSRRIDHLILIKLEPARGRFEPVTPQVEEVCTVAFHTPLLVIYPIGLHEYLNYTMHLLLSFCLVLVRRSTQWIKNY